MGTVISGLLSMALFVNFSFWREAAPCVSQHLLERDGWTMHVDEYRCFPARESAHDKPTLVLLHGGGASLDTYYKNLPYLAKHFRVLAPDTRGHGRSSDDPETPLSYQLLADDVAHMLDDLGVPKAHVVGWSDGGIIAKTFAMTHPERVDKLVLLGSLFHTSGYREEALRRLRQATADDWEPDAKTLYEWVAPDPEYWPILFEKARRMWLSSPNYTTEDLATLEAETLILAADNDEYIRSEHMEQMVESLPNARLRVLKDSDHMFPETHAWQVNRAIKRFLDLGNEL